MLLSLFLDLSSDTMESDDEGKRELPSSTTTHNVSRQEVCQTLFMRVVSRYCNSHQKEFVKRLKSEYGTSKTMAHRKNIQITTCILQLLILQYLISYNSNPGEIGGPDHLGEIC